MTENLLIGHVQQKIMMVEKIRPRIGTDTRANWKIHSKLQEPTRRGMILEPEHKTEDPYVVRSLTPEAEEEAGARKTEREAPESTRNQWKESLS